MRIDLYLHVVDDNASAKLDAIIATLAQLKQEEVTMSAELDALTAEVTNAATVEQSAIALIQGLAAKIESMKNDPAALSALAASLKTQDDALAAAVTANTPAEQ
jgi:hypothetical protein